MAPPAKSKWLAVNLFYNEPWESFLNEAVLPYLDSIVQMGIAEQFFFLRFWERGPHIKLRIKGEQTVLDNLLIENLIEHFQNYFDSKPSLRAEPNYPPNFPENYKWLPNNASQIVDYFPEFYRFGGEVGQSIAEKQFHLSADIVLKNLKEKGEKWSYDEALGLAIKLHLSFIHVMGLSLDEGIIFFEMLFKNWMPRSFQFQNRSYNTTIYLHEEKKTLKQFKEAFELQKDTLIPFHSALWMGLGKEGEFEDQDLNKWIAAHESIRADLALAIELKQIKQPHHLKELRLPPNLSTTNEILWPIFSEFVQGTNNRLGISYKDEGFIAYLMMESLKELRKQKSITKQKEPTKKHLST